MFERESNFKQKTIFWVFYKKSLLSRRECCEWDMLLLNGNVEHRENINERKTPKQNGIENGIVLHFVENTFFEKKLN